MIAALLRHLLLALRLNFRSKSPLIYGYAVPILFLVGFAAVFHSGSPPLLREMGQLLTITVLGGACFGMPTAMVSERERGVWRRYRLLPASISSLVISTMIARLLIIALAVLLQIILARLIFGTPLPLHPVQLAIALICVTFAFEGLGLVIAALADTVPTVQALGQSVFLPMILIGGVGVPLAALPDWAQKLAGFFPGRYAVEVFQPCFSRLDGLWGQGFSLLALLVIGVAACVVGAKLFRWDSGRRAGAGEWVWSSLALLAWIAVGVAAAGTGRLKPIAFAWNGVDEPCRAITEDQINTITYDGLPADDDVVTPMVPTLDGFGGSDKQRLDDLAGKLSAWPPGHLGSGCQSIRNLVSVASIADVSQDPQEGQIGRLIFNYLRDNFDRDQLKRSLAWIALRPQDGRVIHSAPELGLPGNIEEDVVRDRDGLYARKFLGRVVGKIAD